LRGKPGRRCWSCTTRSIYATRRRGTICSKRCAMPTRATSFPASISISTKAPIRRDETGSSFWTTSWECCTPRDYPARLGLDRPKAREPEKGTPMFLSSFLIVAVVLVVAWALGWFAFHVAGGLIHILLVVAVISLVVHFLRGRP